MKVLICRALMGELSAGYVQLFHSFTHLLIAAFLISGIILSNFQHWSTVELEAIW